MNEAWSDMAIDRSLLNPAPARSMVDLGRLVEAAKEHRRLRQGHAFTEEVRGLLDDALEKPS